MTEIARHPYAVRQGAAAAAVAVVTVAALPIMASRAQDQRDAAGAAVTVQSVATSVELQASAASEGWRARGSTALHPSAFRGPSIIVQASLKPSLPSPTVIRSPDLKTASFQAREQHCLAQAIYYEARGEGRTGQLAVAEVVANRVRSSLYPNTFCGVVYQGSRRTTGCQFSFTCDGSTAHTPRGAMWRQAQTLAREVIVEGAPGMTSRATHYHADRITPYWSASLVETTRIGSHVFYRLPTRKEKALLASAQAILDQPAADPFGLDSLALDSAPVGGDAPSPAPLIALDAATTATIKAAPHNGDAQDEIEPVEPSGDTTVALDPALTTDAAPIEVGV
jgi:hypothetical protein